MLPAQQRLRSPEDFRAAIRRGSRAGSRTLVTHLLRPPRQVVDMSPNALHEGPARAGFVVSRAVGSAVVRNRVKRRLRHAVAERLAALDPDTLLVVRAQPAAAEAPFQELATDLDRCLERLLNRAQAERMNP